MMTLQKIKEHMQERLSYREYDCTVFGGRDVVMFKTPFSRCGIFWSNSYSECGCFMVGIRRSRNNPRIHKDDDIKIYTFCRYGKTPFEAYVSSVQATLQYVKILRREEMNPGKQDWLDENIETLESMLRKISLSR